MKRLYLTLLLLGCPASLMAGPPFVTDDPIPVDYRHWEVYLALQLYQNAGSWSGAATQVEVNYGVIPDLQLHLIMPDAFNAPGMGPKELGLGDIELGVKYRFIKQTANIPDVAIFPLVEVPTHTVQGQSGYQGYVAIQFTFGPEGKQ